MCLYESDVAPITIYQQAVKFCEPKKEVLV